MTLRTRIFRHVFAGAVMLIGCALVFTLLDVMNAMTDESSEVGATSRIELTVTRTKQPPKAPRQVQKTRTLAKTSKALTPIPTLGTGISGNSFGIPSLDGLGLGQGADSLLVSDKSVKSLVMTEDSVDVLPKAVSRKQPVYPPRAREKGITGKVTLGILIGSGGEILKVRVQESTPPGIFDDAAMEAVKMWQFEPAMYQGQSVKVWASQTVHFVLS